MSREAREEEHVEGKIEDYTLLVFQNPQAFTFESTSQIFLRVSSTGAFVWPAK